jgi:hypothetical protein
MHLRALAGAKPRFFSGVHAAGSAAFPRVGVVPTIQIHRVVGGRTHAFALELLLLFFFFCLF